ncbi:hypothetical protein QYE76_069872 [Lolium multiflorum]|uniref:Cystatin domain-containing protein n=1 Tax=Lolium multiflorum TaxID=4521 RepID=A0AAD8WFC3_LOLMU|nr:hypothetical protein QYE76_069872 [Lolium multiflorum]
MRQHNILLLTIAIDIVICVTATPTTAREAVSDVASCGWEQIPDINTQEIQEIARWAVAEHARQASDGLQFKRVVSGMQQLVSGVNYKLRIDAVNGEGKEGTYGAEVYDQPWTQTRTLDYFVPTN